MTKWMKSLTAFVCVALGFVSAAYGSCLFTETASLAFYHLVPYNMHLTAGETSAVPLHVVDQNGNPVPGMLTFSVTNRPDPLVFACDFGRANCIGDCNGDFSGDGDVDGGKLATFIEKFGRTDCL